jgi:hypothetical protein
LCTGFFFEILPYGPVPHPPIGQALFEGNRYDENRFDEQVQS